MDRPPNLTSKYVLATVFIFAALIAGLYFFRPYPHPSPRLVEPRLIALQKPYSLVETSYFTDGGSIGISITDAVGCTEHFALPSRMGRNENYASVFVGALHVDRAGAVPVGNSDTTKQELIRILGTYRNDEDIQSTLAMLSGRFADMAKATANRLRAKLKHQFGH